MLVKWLLLGYSPCPLKRKPLLNYSSSRPVSRHHHWQPDLFPPFGDSEKVPSSYLLCHGIDGTKSLYRHMPLQIWNPFQPVNHSMIRQQFCRDYSYSGSWWLALALLGNICSFMKPQTVTSASILCVRLSSPPILSPVVSNHDLRATWCEAHLLRHFSTVIAPVS